MRLGASRWFPVVLVALWTVGCSLFGGSEESIDSGAPADSSSQQVLPGDDIDPSTPAGVEQVGSLWLVNVEVPGFERLEAASRKKALEHSRAAAAADDELYRQLGGELPRIDKMLVGILAIGDRVPAGIRQKLRAYSTRFFANHGNLDARTGRKFLPRFIPGQLAAAAQVALDQGAEIGLADLPNKDLGASRIQELEALMKLVRPWIFDRKFVPEHPARDAGTDAADGSRLADDPSTEISPPPVDPTGAVSTLYGQIATGDDPRGIDRASGALVIVADPRGDAQLNVLRKSAAALDKAIAVELGVEKTVGRVEPTRVTVAEALVATGWYGPILPGASERLASPVVRDPRGAGLIVLTNVAAAADRALGERIGRAFDADEETLARRAKWRSQARIALLALREIVGRGTDGTERRPREFLQNRLGDHRVPIAELRADLTALYLAFSPEVRATGLVPDDECARALYDEYVSLALEQLVLLEIGSALERPRMQAVQIAVRSLIAKRVVAEERSEGSISLKVVDYGKMRDAIGELLAEVREIRQGGQTDRAAELVEKLGRRPPSGWSRGAKEAWHRAELPKLVGFVYPLLEARRQDGKSNSDVHLVASESLVDAQISSINEVNR